MSADTKFAKQSILGKPPSSSRPKLYIVTPLPKSMVFPKECLGLILLSLLGKKSRTNLITASQPIVITKKVVNSDSNGLSSTRVDNTAKTRRPQLRINIKNDRKQKANALINENQKKQKPKVMKPKKVGSNERLASPKPSKPRSFLRWSPTGILFDLKGKIIASSEFKSQSDCSNGDNACTSNPLEPTIKRFPNSTFFLGRSKDEAPEVIKTFLKRITILLQSPVIVIRTDNDTTFKNQLLKEYFDSDDISHRVSSVRTPQQNGVVERKNRTLVEAARTMLIFSRASLFLWAEAITTVCYTQKCSIIHRQFNKTPYELINGKKPYISFLHVFGALCYPKNDREDIGKLGAKGDIGFFISYSADSCAYRFYNRRTKKIMETMNVTFDELSAMAFEQSSSKPELQSMTSGQISLGLDLTDASSKITTQQPTKGLWYTKDSGFELSGFLDADYAGCKDTFKSTSGGAQFLGEKLVSWSSKKQDCMVLSTVEAEYVSLSACCAQFLWIQTLLTDYGFHFNKIPIHCDLKSAIAISCNPVQHSRTKNITVRYHFIKEHVKKGTLKLYFVKTDYQLADLFTKALPVDRFNYLVRRLGMRSLSSQ
nr:retrovirus-related Pol polyprotein from transposon TNT 1-94 [Tanacetum cinerariifolium]